MSIVLELNSDETTLKRNYDDFITFRETLTENQTVEVELRFGEPSQSIIVYCTGGKALWVTKIGLDPKTHLDIKDFTCEKYTASMTDTSTKKDTQIDVLFTKYDVNEMLGYLVRKLQGGDSGNIREYMGFITAAFFASEAARSELCTHAAKKYVFQENGTGKEGEHWKNYLTVMKNWNSFSKFLYSQEKKYVKISDLKSVISTSNCPKEIKDLRNLISEAD